MLEGLSKAPDGAPQVTEGFLKVPQVTAKMLEAKPKVLDDIQRASNGQTADLWLPEGATGHSKGPGGVPQKVAAASKALEAKKTTGCAEEAKGSGT